MILVKENTVKQRKVYYTGHSYIKVWDNKSTEWVKEHARILDIVVPNYVISSGDSYIEYKVVEGKTANTFEHTDKFIDDIYKFCVTQIETTLPFVHGDWVLSNIVINDNNMTMIDWDNVGIYPKVDAYDKLHKDLYSQFGERFKKYDTTSI